MLFVILSVCPVSRHAGWRTALGVKWLSYDCKGLRGFLMETCLLSPVGYPTSAVSSWGRGEGWRVGERRGRGLTWINLSYLPWGPPVNNPATVAFSFTLCLSRFLALLFHHFPCLCISPYPFISLPLTLSPPSLYFSFDTTKQITLTWADVPLSDCHFHFTASYWEQLWPLDPRRLFVLATSDVTQNSNKLWRTT